MLFKLDENNIGSQGVKFLVKAKIPLLETACMCNIFIIKKTATLAQKEQNI